ncbi:hypothetical protein BJF83_24965 [Nocardiopsis sp. CNR-923]|uniref:transposase family protein n=1 Tax=Nocardiopsis sp. CNR-923 TaxID=1904965 RepID=UPI00095F5A8A|nr:transposase family protein [Nocardiopsis sp. CNR-923]OLT30174.1 hypothetical protein BJF83_24965 [Nocardiopsis sp. CNR-923]
MSLSPLIALLFPHLSDLHVTNITRTGTTLQIHAATQQPTAVCPCCGSASTRVHSRYRRHLLDTPISGQQALIQLQVRRYFCDNPECDRQTFAEQVPGPTSPYSRSTPLLRRTREIIALALVW